MIKQKIYSVSDRRKSMCRPRFTAFPRKCRRAPGELTVPSPRLVGSDLRENQDYRPPNFWWLNDRAGQRGGGQRPLTMPILGYTALEKFPAQIRSPDRQGRQRNGRTMSGDIMKRETADKKRAPVDTDDQLTRAISLSQRVVDAVLADELPARAGGVKARPRGKTISCDDPHCGARTRSGKPCRALKVRGRPRCRMHGGTNPGRACGQPKFADAWNL